MKFEELCKVNAGLATTPIKGKDYVEVNKRVMAFRQLEPNGSIITEIVSLENEMCVIKATITNEEGRIISTGLAYEKETSSYINKTSYIENCETSAVGRALGFLGIGIDTSIASVEEMNNALHQQEVNKDNKSLDAEATDIEKKTFKDMCDLLKVDYRDILRQTGVKGRMTKEQHGKAMIILKDIEDSRK